MTATVSPELAKRKSIALLRLEFELSRFADLARRAAQGDERAIRDLNSETRRDGRDAIEVGDPEDWNAVKGCYDADYEEGQE